EVLFMILVPNEAGDEHITILSSLARRLMDDEFTNPLPTPKMYVSLPLSP
ncbi:MAG: PTS transporter subunit EIIA, partial [Nitrospira sp.]|nr:PTS transporter subunit EIIA [Nitrospira sp.]